MWARNEYEHTMNFIGKDLNAWLNYTKGMYHVRLEQIFEQN